MRLSVHEIARVMECSEAQVRRAAIRQGRYIDMYDEVEVTDLEIDTLFWLARREDAPLTAA